MRLLLTATVILLGACSGPRSATQSEMPGTTSGLTSTQPGAELLEGSTERQLAEPDTSPGPSTENIAGQRPVAAIVIDDCGESVEQIMPFIGIPLPLSFSILPYQAGTADTVALLKNLGRDMLVHVPMEPHDPRWLENDWFLRCEMTREKIAERLNRALAAVPGASGINNHMGSKFCADTAGMTAVMHVLAEMSLYYLDSRTSAESKAAAAASAASVKFLQRDVFLDNDDNADLIMKQLELLEKNAKKNGCAIGIGHARSATAAAIMRYARHRDSDVVLVPAARFFDYCPDRQADGHYRNRANQTPANQTD